MRSFTRLLLCLALLGAAASVPAQELQPLKRGDYRQLVEKRNGKPFIVAFWSVDCAYCGAELEMLGKVLARHRTLDLVMVSTDFAMQPSQISSVLERNGLARAESRVFADAHAERLRYEADPEWYGELPRTYFHFDGEMEGISGQITQGQVERWLKAHGVR